MANDPETVDYDAEIDNVTPEEMAAAEDAPPEVMQALEKELDAYFEEYGAELEKLLS